MIDVKKVEDFEKLTTALNGISTAIENMPQPTGGGIDYSTEEQDTGLKWIDGSKIYQKTFDKRNTVLTTHEWNNDVLGTSNINIIKFEGYISNTDDASLIPYTFYRSSSSYVSTTTNPINSDISIYNDISAYTICVGIITIWYTKTA